MIEKVLDSETVYFCCKCYGDVKGILLIFELEGICWAGILFEKNTHVCFSGTENMCNVRDK